MHKLQARMKAMQGKSTWEGMARKKSAYKEEHGLSDGDTTPSEFDPHESDSDSGTSDDSDGSD